MKKYWKTALIAPFILSGFIFQSCSNDEDEGEVKQLYYLSSDVATSFPVVMEVSLLDNTIGGTRTQYYVVAKSTMRVDADVKLNLAQENALVDAYNKENNKEYAVVPEGTFTLSSQALTIKAGNNFSSDTLYISPENLSNLEETKTYLLPITLKEADNSGTISSNRNTIYFVLSKKDIKVSTNKPATWVALERSTWTATASDQYAENYTADKAIDGSASLSWFTYIEESAWWAAEWETPETVVGISISRQGAFGSSYNLKTFSVSYKKQGDTDWQTLEDIITLNSSSSYRPQYTAFSSALENIVAFRVNVQTPAQGSYTGIGELNLYKK